jgi:pantoate--beta-alanine ligase
VLTIRSVPELRAELAPHRRDGARIGLVPTMGALHDGHLSLLRHARVHCDVVVMSLFVNPRQFNDAGDLAGYPRDEARDARLAGECGVDVLFAPAADAIYPAGFATTVSVRGPSEDLESAHRGHGHFEGVATVVIKLLNMAGPDVAYFGAKDAQQLAVIRRMATDLDLPVAIEARPTVREPDGLAMSSRNALLSGAERERATALYRALRRVHDAVGEGERDAATATAGGLRELAAAGVQTEYLQLVDPVTMTPLATLDRGGLAVVAARIGAVRLIDNLAVPIPRTHHPTHHEVATPTGAPTT